MTTHLNFEHGTPVMADQLRAAAKQGDVSLSPQQAHQLAQLLDDLTLCINSKQEAP